MVFRSRFFTAQSAGYAGSAAAKTTSTATHAGAAIRTRAPATPCCSVSTPAWRNRGPEIRSSHTCVENAMHQNCPVCLQDLFQSTIQVTILQCGHTIHQECLRELQMSFAGLQSLRCPICNVSLYKYEDLWAEMDRQVAEMPMPSDYQNVQIGIICNDCQHTAAVQFHVLGHKCPVCSSYNTRRA
eukprot:TRINITY_DN11859_c0_g1_i2.p2 TRINITY_DN11859_c0_g1~~TRINITY_DN11859_c0_g1_i2.p2  ORF type:complete len:185 (+),score=15.43 TRINITY_DN11859_c0_g1_i2:441-995(+)